MELALDHRVFERAILLCVSIAAIGAMATVGVGLDRAIAEGGGTSAIPGLSVSSTAQAAHFPGRAAEALTKPLEDMARAAQVIAIDRWPDRVSHPLIWERLGFAKTFVHHHWEGHSLSPGVTKWIDRVESLETSRPLRAWRSWRNDRIAKGQLQRGLRIDDVNAGPGRRCANSLQCALAADGHLGGHPQSALPWLGANDPVESIDLRTAAALVGPMARASNIDEAERVVRAWGPGAKGLVALSLADEAHHRVINVV
ncbi:MAG: hypothetical protein KC416_09075, partial [Myxococcales bacterium]|nr:hypothetical protein [Myxococcales bacterium]